MSGQEQCHHVQKKKKKKETLFSIVRGPPFHPAIFPARAFSARAASNLVPIHRLYHPLSLSRNPRSKVLRPRPTSAVEHRPLLVPVCASKRGACARKRREASASCRGRRTNVVGQPTDRPTDRLDRAVSSQPGQYQAGSRREGCSTSAIGAHATLFRASQRIERNAATTTNDARPC